MMLTLREALKLPALAGARVVAGAAGLDGVVQRVHVVDIPDAKYAWGQGALLLTAGYGLKDSQQRQAELIPTLVKQGLVGMVFCIGLYFDAVPDVIRAQADAHDFPVIAVPPDVPFISITEQLYTHIVGEQSARKARGDFLTQLLQSNSVLDAAMRERARALGYRLEQSHQILFITRADIGDDGYAPVAARLEGLLRAASEWTLTVVREHGVVLLVESKSSEVGQKLAKRLARADDFIIGVSQIHEADKSLRRSYNEAMEAAEIGRRLGAGPNVVLFWELGLLDWLYRLPPEILARNAYLVKIEALVAHDRERQSELFPTLRAYLDSGGALAEAAAAINVHRNTLLYRLRRIEAMLNIDLKDTQQRLNLHVALLAHQLSK